MNLKDRLIRVYNLSQRGVGGEKENAKKILQRLLAANNMTLQDFLNKKGILDPEIINERFFYYGFFWPYGESVFIKMDQEEFLNKHNGYFRQLKDPVRKELFLLNSCLEDIYEKEGIEINSFKIYSLPWYGGDLIVISSRSNVVEKILREHGLVLLKKQELYDKEAGKIYEDLHGRLEKYLYGIAEVKNEKVSNYLR
ncbi:MAG: hypothetical protein II972_01790 [Elusimicrobiaceae bacterium]|nr:hypothetical protein [Elusimicrobiaceae bacterium]